MHVIRFQTFCKRTLSLWVRSLLYSQRPQYFLLCEQVSGLLEVFDPPNNDITVSRNFGSCLRTAQRSKIPGNRIFSSIAVRA